MNSRTLFLSLLFFVHGLNAQHAVPVGSTGNTIALTITNSSYLPLPEITVRVLRHPSWISVTSGSVHIPMLVSNSQEEVHFSFNVDPATPAGKEGTITFDIESAWGARWAKEVDLITALPASVRLHQNYPNPFNPITVIPFTLPQAGFVSLKVFDILGRELSTLVNEQRPAGSHHALFDASTLPSGVYFYKLHATGTVAIQKMILAR
jgi:hypothetical protein